MQEVHVLWTGGFDSTFRIAQLARSNVAIQPYYILDKRASQPNELRAIAEITKNIQQHPETVCTIRPLVTLESKAVKPDKEITDAYLRMHEVDKLGSQYDWLARYAKDRNIEFEICLENEPGSKALACIQKYSVVRELTDGCVSYCAVDHEKSTSDGIAVFGRFRFPLPLFAMSKLQTLEEYKRLGFEGLVAMTWFCHTPRKGVPCGLCNPCKSVIDSGLTFRMPRSAMVRFYLFRKQPLMWALYRKKSSLRRALNAYLSRRREERHPAVASR